jgi:hypothetical protein
VFEIHLCILLRFWVKDLKNILFPSSSIANNDLSVLIGKIEYGFIEKSKKVKQTNLLITNKVYSKKIRKTMKNLIIEKTVYSYVLRKKTLE